MSKIPIFTVDQADLIISYVERGRYPAYVSRLRDLRAAESRGDKIDEGIFLELLYQTDDPAK